ncbi:hypothetical protein D3C75_1004260 [compost metagenome]
MGEHEAVQVFAEVFHHVVTLGFAVHQYVQPQAFLLGNGLLDMFADAGPVVAPIQAALLEVQAQAANFGGLREGSDGGRWPGRQVEAIALSLGTLFIRALTFAVFGSDGRQALLNLRIMHTAGLATGADWCAVGIQFGLFICPWRIQS